MRGRAAFVGAVLVALVAACGGGGGGKKLTHDEFVQKANAICADYNGRLAELATVSSFDSVVKYAEQARAIAEDDVAKFKKLNPPDEDRDNWKAFGEKGDEIIAASRDLEDAAKKQDAAEIQKILAAGRQRSAESKQIATAMGTAECAK